MLSALVAVLAKILNPLSAIFTVAALICSIIGFYFMRRSSPRFALYSICSLIFGLGLWVLSSTVDLAMQDQAHDFGRSFNSVFSKNDHPNKFIFSVGIYTCLGIAGTTFGLWGILVTKRQKTISFNS